MIMVLLRNVFFFLLQGFVDLFDIFIGDFLQFIFAKEFIVFRHKVIFFRMLGTFKAMVPGVPYRYPAFFRDPVKCLLQLFAPSRYEQLNTFKDKFLLHNTLIFRDVVFHQIAETAGHDDLRSFLPLFGQQIDQPCDHFTVTVTKPA